MLSFPTSTVFERRIPKQKFYQNLDVTAEVKRLFIEQIKLITWANKLSAQTMNLAPGQTRCSASAWRAMCWIAVC